MIERPMSWAGDNPYYLLISLAAGGIAIDLDEPGWATQHSDYLRVKSIWYLVRKIDEAVLLAVVVNEGEQPYYTARHVGVAVMGGEDGKLPAHEVVFFGIGKKRQDGHVDRLWVGPRGLVCGGDDPEHLGRHLLQVMIAMEEEARRATEAAACLETQSAIESSPSEPSESPERNSSSALPNDSTIQTSIGHNAVSTRSTAPSTSAIPDVATLSSPPELDERELEQTPQERDLSSSTTVMDGTPGTGTSPTGPSPQG